MFGSTIKIKYLIKYNCSDNIAEITECGPRSV